MHHLLTPESELGGGFTEKEADALLHACGPLKRGRVSFEEMVDFLFPDGQPMKASKKAVAPDAPGEK